MSLARATDPQTSHSAGKGKRDVRAEILAAFRRRPVKGWTDFELEAVIVDKTGVSPQRVRTTRAELTGKRMDGPHGFWYQAPGEHGDCIVPVEGVTRPTPRGYAAQVFRLA